MLNLSSQSQQAVNSIEVITYNLFEVYYEPPEFSSSDSYEAGQIVFYNGGAYTSLGSNPAPSVAPPNASYWSLDQYPLCLTDWSEPVAYDSRIYTPAAIKLGKVAVNQDGRILDTPLSVGIGHDDMTVMKLVEDYDLIGKKIVIHTFIEGADDRPSITFKIKSAKPKKSQIDITLSLGFGYFLTQLPGRTIYQSFCRHIFNYPNGKGARCKYSGNDTTCTHTFDECEAKGNLINFGGFPGVVKTMFFF